MVNGIRKTKIVSFPRSGHHLLVRGLQSALQNEMVYCEPYKSTHHMDVCSFTNVQKSHDFDLTEPINPELHYIVQIRGFELAVESWYKVAQAEGYQGTLEDFRAEKSDYFDGFMAKWVNSIIPNKIVISYHDLVTDKMNTLIKAYRHITDLELNDQRLNGIRLWADCESRYKPLKTAFDRKVTEDQELSYFRTIGD